MNPNKTNCFICRMLWPFLIWIGLSVISLAGPEFKPASTSPDGTEKLLIRQYKEQGSLVTEFALKASGSKQRFVDVPDNLATTETRSPKFQFKWSSPIGYIICVARWQHSDELMFCDLSKSKLAFQDLQDPDWASLLGSGRDFHDEAYKYIINIDDISYNSKSKIKVTFATTKDDGPVVYFEAIYDLTKPTVLGGVTRVKNR